jgi:multidrug resistance efflux pump
MQNQITIVLKMPINWWSYKQQLDQAKVALTNAAANYRQAKLNVGDTRIKAPISGIINKRFIEPGSMLTAMPATQLFEIVNVNTRKYCKRK